MLAYAVTPVHVGMGRAPGIVDLPVQRDTIGYPIVYGSSFKGVLKSSLMNGKNDNLAKCLFGSEPEDDVKQMGRLIVTDLIPLFYPVASLSGYIYVTTDYLIRRAEDLLTALGLSKLYSGKNGKNVVFEVLENQAREVEILLGKLKAAYVVKPGDAVKNLGSLIRDVSEIYVFSNDIGLNVVESSLVRIARNKLNDSTKTSENLWTEEYLPQGTVMIGGIIDAERQNEFCKNVNMNDAMMRLKDISVFLGGKETVGKGLIKVKVIDGGEK